MKRIAHDEKMLGADFALLISVFVFVCVCVCVVVNAVNAFVLCRHFPKKEHNRRIRMYACE